VDLSGWVGVGLGGNCDCHIFIFIVVFLTEFTSPYSLTL